MIPPPVGVDASAPTPASAIRCSGEDGAVGTLQAPSHPPPPYPPSTMHSPMTCAHPAPSSSSPLMAQPAVFVGVVSHHLGLTSPRRLRRLLCFSPRPPPSCVIVSSVVAPNPDDDNAADDAAADNDDDDDAVSAASTTTTDAACGSLPP